MYLFVRALRKAEGRPDTFLAGFKPTGTGTTRRILEFFKSTTTGGVVPESTIRAKFPARPFSKMTC